MLSRNNDNLKNCVHGRLFRVIWWCAGGARLPSQAIVFFVFTDNLAYIRFINFALNCRRRTLLWNALKSFTVFTCRSFWDFSDQQRLPGEIGTFQIWPARNGKDVVALEIPTSRWVMKNLFVQWPLRWRNYSFRTAQNSALRPSIFTPTKILSNYTYRIDSRRSLELSPWL